MSGGEADKNALRDNDTLIVVAQLGGAHGVRGDVRVRSFTEYPEDCFAYGPLLNDRAEVILTVKKASPNKDGFIVTPQENREREVWNTMKGMLLHVPRSALPTPDQDEFYVADLIGCDVVHEDGRKLGRVTHVHNFGADDLIELEAPGVEAYMLPFTLAAVPGVDMKARLLTAMPDELMLPEALQLPGFSADAETEADDDSGKAET